ncbi:hypothetical protein DL95DRAFT_398406 [Leptodontidium sp. 2 PMI_412]|nr:hypothetical protein DL95DRAFT_398406 [Leptodontidium sp. 2 PMI_412]
MQFYGHEERIEETTDRCIGFPRAPPKQRMGDLWTEITKDLVAREAIEELGYDYEETEFFFYVLQYLRYYKSPNGYMGPKRQTTRARRFHRRLL